MEDFSKTFCFSFFLHLYVTLEIQFVSAIKDCVASGSCGENKVKKKRFLVRLCLRKFWGLIFANTFFLPFFPTGEQVS